jgi:DNA-binding NarL/FixJ family response regulator
MGKDFNLVDVWIVEDNINYSQALTAAINNNAGIVCTKQFGCITTLLKALSNSKLPDVILMDIELPDVNGIEATKQIKSLYGEIIVIILTVFDDDEKIFNAICNGADGYLLKDSSPDAVSEEILSAVNGGSPITPGIAKKVFKLFSSMKPSENIYGLTNREKEILTELVNGKTAKEIGEILQISSQTVQTHVKNIYFKLHVNSRSSVVAKTLKEKLI